MSRRLIITMKDGAQVWRDFKEDSVPTLEEYLAEITAKGNWGKPGEFTHTITDITSEIAAEESKVQQDKVKRESVEKVDWATVNSIAELKVIVKNIAEVVFKK